MFEPSESDRSSEKLRQIPGRREMWRPEFRQTSTTESVGTSLSELSSRVLRTDAILGINPVAFGGSDNPRGRAHEAGVAVKGH